MGGTPLVLLLDVLGHLGVLGVEFSFCIEGGTVGMASTVLVAWLLDCWSTGDSCGISGRPVVSWGSVETEFLSLCLGLMKLLFLLKHCPVAGISTMLELGSLHFSRITASSHFLESEFWSHTFCPALNGNALILSWKSLVFVYNLPSFFAMSSLCLLILSFMTCDGRMVMLDQSFLPNRISAGDGISLEIGVHL